MSTNYGPQGPQQPFQPQGPWQPQQGFPPQPPYPQQPMPQHGFPGQPQGQWQQPYPPLQPTMFQQPPFQPMQLGFPQKRRSFKQWFSSQKRFTKIGFGCGIIFLVLMLCTCSLAAYGSTLPKQTASSTPIVNNTTGSLTRTKPKVRPTTLPTKRPTQQPTSTLTKLPTPTPIQQPTPTQQPTPAPIPTQQPTPTPTAGNTTVTHSTPQLGGLISDFVGKYGPPNHHIATGMDHFLGNSSGPGGLIVTYTSGTPNVDGIDDIPTNGTIWTSATAQVICMSYAPVDAHKINQIPLTSANGYDVVYTSSWLATRFSADNFTDVNGNTVQAGTFDVQYLIKYDGSIDSCNMQLGSQQTQ